MGVSNSLGLVSGNAHDEPMAEVKPYLGVPLASLEGKPIRESARGSDDSTALPGHAGEAYRTTDSCRGHTCACHSCKTPKPEMILAALDFHQ